MRNPFKALTEEEKAERKVRSGEVEKEVKKLSKLGREMLADPKYQEFTQSYKEAKENLISVLIHYENRNSKEFTFNIVRIQERLKALENLVQLPHIAILNEVKFEATKKEGEK